ncbi:histidine kinase [Kribbella sp. NPDC023855]|uniref:sensor histidine kinase n=1 Tax=Kribbella sp. NPDC023855 TaxID=3154698 RepID=UPI00340BF04B
MEIRAGLGLLTALGAIPVSVWWSARIDPQSGIAAAVAACLALAVVVSWPQPRNWVALPAAVAALVSLSSTTYVLLTDYSGPTDAGRLGFVEVGGLLVLLAFVVRWSPLWPGLPVGLATSAAATMWILRFIPSSDPLSLIGGCALWGAGSLIALVVGGYPRVAAARLRDSVVNARQAQRLHLAHDLHDFVAHDVTGIVAQAQAGRFVGESDPATMRAALERIEAAGQEALAALDYLVEMLGHDQPSAAPTIMGLAGLPDLVERFKAERQPGCTVELEQRLARPLATLPPQAHLTAYRVAVESLTNVRRHAPAARHVHLRLETTPSLLRLVIVNDLAEAPKQATGRRLSGGYGLQALSERLHAIGGRLDAHRTENGCWTVSCEIPLERHQRA